jgi:hypothetical protein
MQSILDGLKGAYDKAKAAVQGPAQQMVDSTGLSDVNPPGVQPESSGMTTTGAKRGGRRTRRSKKSKKTIRKRKH